MPDWIRRVLVHSLLIGGMALWVGLFGPTAMGSKFVNNYNLPDLDWYTIETEHFNVHYPVS